MEARRKRNDGRKVRRGMIRKVERMEKGMELEK
jgi:hypothetical protein